MIRLKVKTGRHFQQTYNKSILKKKRDVVFSAFTNQVPEIDNHKLSKIINHN